MGVFNLQAIGIAKGVVVSFCLLLALSAIAMALNIRTEREAILHCVRRARLQLSRYYARKRMQCRVNSSFFFTNPKRQLNASLKQAYREAWDKINDKKEEALHLTQRIISAKTLHWSEKEILLNQAIEELHEKLFLLVHTFKSSP